MAVDSPYRQAEYVLAYLALYGRTERGELARAIWPDRPQDRAMLSLRQAISRINRSFEHPWLDSDRHTVALQRAVQTDIQLLQTRLKSLPDHRPADDEEIRAQLAQPICENWLVPWLDSPRAKWREFTRDNLPHQEIPESPHQYKFSQQIARGTTVEAFLELLAWLRTRSLADARKLVFTCRDLLPAMHARKIIEHIAPLYGDDSSLSAEDLSTLDFVARAHYLVGERDNAERIYSLIAEGAIRLGNWIVATSAATSMAVVLREAGQAKRAFQLMNKWQERLPANCPAICRTYVQVQSGMALAHLGDLAAGIRELEDASGPMRVSAAAITLIFFEANLALLYLDAGKISAAELCAKTALRHARYVNDMLGNLTVRALDCLLEVRRTSEALVELQTIAAECVRLQYPHLAVQICDRLASLLCAASRWDKCSEFLLFSEALRKRNDVIPTPWEERQIKEVLAALTAGAGDKESQRLLRAVAPADVPALHA